MTLKKVDNNDYVLPRYAAYELANRINSVSDCRGQKFSYIILKNARKLQSMINEMNMKQKPKPTPEYIDFNKKREDLCLEMVKRDEQNNVLFKTDKDGKHLRNPDGSMEYDIDNVEEYNRRYKVLLDAHPVFQAQIDNRNKEARLFRDEKIDFKEILHFIDMEDMSDDITTDQLDEISFFVNDESIRRI